jgi:phenylacetate-CoA ligase
MLGGKYGALVWLLGNAKKSRRRLQRIQDRLARDLAEHACANVEFYRKLFLDAGVRPQEIRTAADVSRLPVIDAARLRAAALAERTDRRATDRSRLVEIGTSGSSGVPYTFYVDRGYDRFRKAQYLRPYLANGRRLSDVVLRLSDVDPALGTARARPDKGWFRRTGLLREYRLFAGEDPEHQLREIDRLRPDVIQGYPSSLGLLSSKILDERREVHRPRLVFTDSELLAPSTRRRIERGLRAPVLDVYGSFETDNIAFECSRREGYHVACDCVILEIVKDGRTVEPGTPGEVVCTVLHNRTMPFIRYNLHDIAAYSRRPCSCGSSLPLLQVLEGRSDDLAVDATGNARSAWTFLDAFDELWPVREYQIVQTRVDHVEMLVVPADGYDESAASLLRAYMRQYFPNATTEVRIVERIERGPAGKHKIFRSLLGKPPSAGEGSRE